MFSRLSDMSALCSEVSSWRRKEQTHTLKRWLLYLTQLFFIVGSKHVFRFSSNPISRTIFTNPSGCTHLNLGNKLKHTPITKCRFHPARGESQSVVCPVQTIILEFWKNLSSETITAPLNSYKVSWDSGVWEVLLFRLSSVLGSLDNDYPTWHICPQKETEPGWDRKRQITEIRYTEADVSDLIWVPPVLSSLIC